MTGRRLDRGRATLTYNRPMATSPTREEAREREWREALGRLREAQEALRALGGGRLPSLGAAALVDAVREDEETAPSNG